jgi:predicted  nucleic acid-binding Zn-ribbon protein
MDLNKRKEDTQTELNNLDSRIKQIRNALAQAEQQFLVTSGKLMEINEQLALEIDETIAEETE